MEVLAHHYMENPLSSFCFFFFNDTATTEIYTLSLHDALPIYGYPGHQSGWHLYSPHRTGITAGRDRKSTRLNSSHVRISYAVFCLKKKKPKRFPPLLIAISVVRCMLLFPALTLVLARLPPPPI